MEVLERLSVRPLLMVFGVSWKRGLSRQWGG